MRVSKACGLKVALAAVLPVLVLFALPAASAWAGDGQDDATGVASADDSCPSTGKTLMTATGGNSVGGYGCGYIDYWAEHGESPYAVEVWTSAPATGYTYHYTCYHRSDTHSLVPVTLSSNSVPGAFWQITMSNDNSSTHDWGTAVVWNTGNPQGLGSGTLTAGPPTPGYPYSYATDYGGSDGCNYGTLPGFMEYAVHIQPPGFTTASPGQATVGQAFSVPFSTSVVGGSALPDGQPIYLQAQASGGPLSWTGCVQDVGASSCGKIEDPPASDHFLSYLTQQGLGGAYGAAVSPDGKNVYATGFNDSAVATFARDTSGNVDNLTGNPPAAGVPVGGLSPKGCVADAGSTIGCPQTQQGLGGAASLAVSPDGKNVYVAGFYDNAIVSFSRDPSTGTLAPQGCISSSASTGCATTTIGLAGAQSVAVSPDGKSVYVSGQGNNAVVTFARDPSTGALTPQGCIADAGSTIGCARTQQGLGGAAGLVVSPDNTSVYVVSQTDNAIVILDRNTSTGALTPPAGACVADTGTSIGCATAPGLGLPNGVAISQDGQSVYVASYRSNSVSIFSRAASGTLGWIGCVANNNNTSDTSACGVTHAGLINANRVAVSPDGKSVYVTGAGDNSVDRFTRNTSTTTGVYGLLSFGGGNGCLNKVGTGEWCPTGNALGGPNGVAVSPDGKSVYVASYYDSSVVHLVPWAGLCAVALTSSGCSKSAQANTANGGGTLTFTPPVAGKYTLRIAYPGLNQINPSKGWTPSVSPSFPVTAAPASSASDTTPTASAASPVGAAADPGPAPAPTTMAAASGSGDLHLPRFAWTQKLPGFGHIAIVNSQFSVPKSGRVSSSLSQLGCPRGYALLHVEAASVGRKHPPVNGVSVGQSSSGAVKLNIPQGARGHSVQTQLLCRQRSARHVFRTPAGIVFGTVRSDRIVLARSNRTAFGGLGDDQIIVTARGGTVDGGLGNDRIILRAPNSKAIGGPGDDTLISQTSGRTLLWGGPGRDRLIGGRGPTIINALDGQGDDTVVCHSPKNLVLADPGDVLIGPCRTVTLH